jgi:hypothetical protein
VNGIITRAASGARDLYFGVPDLEGAVVTHSESLDREEYTTQLTLEKEGKQFLIIIKQA